MFTWKKTTLDKLGFVSTGKQTHKPEYDPALFCGGMVPLIESQLVEGDRFFVGNARKYYNDLGIKQSRIYEAETVCITNNGRVNASILKVPSCLSNQLHGFNAFENISDPRFVKYCFNFSDIRRQLATISSIGAKYLPITKLLKIPFPNPPFELQQKIGKIISTYDLLIENYQSQIEEAKKQ
ncbi:hypothetical protein A6V39_05785, partial [Candidatus Mycoplasma haematobovis]